MKKEQYTILVLDDQLDSMEHILTTLKQIPYVDVRYVENNIVNARRIVEKEGVDILFLDVLMPEADGFTFLGFLQKTPATVICSASGESAYDAFDHEVVDYISKLASRKRVERALMKAIKEVDGELEQNKNKEMSFFLIRISDNMEIRLDWRTISYVSITDEVLTVHSLDSKEEKYYCSLSAFMEKVPADKFVRVHRSHVVRVDAIRQRKRRTLILWNWEELPVGLSYIGKLDEMMKPSKP